MVVHFPDGTFPDRWVWQNFESNFLNIFFLWIGLTIMLLSHSKATDGGLHTGPRRHEHCSQGCWSQCLGSQRPERLNIRWHAWRNWVLIIHAYIYLYQSVCTSFIHTKLFFNVIEQ
jgi:hypothetical protein